MLLTSEEVIERLQAHCHRLLREFNIQRIGLYGSYARNEAIPDSDIDLVYQMLEGHSMGFAKLLELEEFLVAVLKIEKLDLVNYRYMNPIVRFKMEKEVLWVLTQKNPTE